MFFDHMVIFEKRDLENCVTLLKESGMKAGIGGRHENWGTENALLYFGLSYVEWLSVFDLETARASDNPLVQKLLNSPNGPGHFAIRTDNMQRLISRLDQAGLRTVHLPGERRRADGRLLQWELLFVDGEQEYWPFFIKWNEEDDERLNDLESSGWTGWQESSDLKIEHIEIAVGNAARTAQVWSDLLDIPRLENEGCSELLKLEGGNIRLVSMPDGRTTGPIELLLSNGQVIK
ncbi:VOC family protein [Fictibacillus aquaticus]|nr:VOC family protein [Fictibacillus aquaticus]